ncbi:hypothetical protein [Gryllotalpicola sp.]|uniref:hypothetical protein n=1 Tax=Gryllotalpicola sp. TaxID=1932787 RepID=UPI00262828FE|nr:hypothetical protein [Gryllotalpicola sp.]
MSETPGFRPTAPAWLTADLVLGALVHAAAALVGTLAIAAAAFGLFAAGWATNPFSSVVAVPAASAFYSLVDLGLGGSVSAVATGPLGDYDATLHVPLLALTAAYLAVVMWWPSRRGSGLVSASHLARWTGAVITGAAFALAVTLLGLAFATHFSLPLFGGLISLEGGITPTGVRLFCSAFVLVTLAAGTARELAVAGGLRVLWVRIPGYLRELATWGAAALAVFGAATITGGLVEITRMFHSFWFALLSLPTWFGEGTVLLVSFGHLGGALDYGDIAGFNGIPASWGYAVLVPLAVLVALYSGLRIGAGRLGSPPNLIQRAIPVAIVLLAWLIAPYLIVNASVTVSGSGASYGEHLVVAPWTFATVTAFAIGVDAIATWVTPWLQGRAPQVIAWVQRPRLGRARR